jgi:hypothetical protein
LTAAIRHIFGDIDNQRILRAGKERRHPRLFAPLAGRWTTQQCSLWLVPAMLEQTLLKQFTIAQASAPAAKRATWSDTPFATVLIKGRSLRLYKRWVLVPTGETELQSVLLRTAHDDSHQLLGAQRVIQQLKFQAHISWDGTRRTQRIGLV